MRRELVYWSTSALLLPSIVAVTCTLYVRYVYEEKKSHPPWQQRQHNSAQIIDLLPFALLLAFHYRKYCHLGGVATAQVGSLPYSTAG